MKENDEVNSYYIENTKFSRIALAQVYYILSDCGDDIENIPERVIRFLEDNMDKTYDFDYGEDLESFKLEKDAENLLIYIYTKYLAPEEERKVIENMANMQQLQKEKEKQKQFSNDIFNSDTKLENQQEEQFVENTLPVEYKESLIKKILRFLKKLFKNK